MSKALKISLLTIGGIILVGFLGMVVSFWPGSTKDIEAVANKFQPSSEWVLESETINPPRLVCLQADCGEISRVWSLPNNLSTEEFRQRLEASGLTELWNNDISCAADPRISGSGQILCETSGVTEGVNITLYAVGDYTNPTEARFVMRAYTREE